MITHPETNILTYRLVPADVQQWLARSASLSTDVVDGVHQLLNALTVEVQKTQREQGKSFVSRTTLTPPVTNGATTVVFRVVLANPLTTNEILREILDEQVEIASEGAAANILQQIRAIMGADARSAALAN
jgi:glutamate/tyrosine decarboxylase-like PLP-dependent enzyme